jgi:uncharacterized protein YcfL
MKIWHLLFLVVLLLTACSSNNGTTATTLSGQSATTLADSVTATTLATTTPLQGADASTELINSMKMKANIQWKAVYDISAAGKSYEMTQYIKGLKRFRTDMSLQGMESRTYMVDDVYSSCTKVMDKWNCFKIDVPKQDESDKAIQSNPTDYTIVADGTMNVAGTTAKCFKVTGLKIEGTFRYCYSNEGVLLYTKMQTAQATTEMTAKSYTTSVSDSEFVLPAEATQMTMPSYLS